MTLLRLAAGGLVSLAAAAAAVHAAEPAAKPWYAKLTPGRAETPAPQPVAEPTPRIKSVGPLDPVVLLEAVKAEQAACDRRLEVCRKIREIALANNDDALSREAEAMEQKVVALFKSRVARFGGKSGWKSPEAANTQPAREPFQVVTP